MHSGPPIHPSIQPKIQPKPDPILTRAHSDRAHRQAHVAGGEAPRDPHARDGAVPQGLWPHGELLSQWVGVRCMLLFVVYSTYVHPCLC